MMMFFDMPLEELQTYKPPREEPPDFDAYNHFTGPKEIRVWRYNDHEGGETYHTLEKIKFLTDLWR